MSRWDKHFNIPESDISINSVESMQVLRRQGTLLQVECPRDGTRFWFDTLTVGNNSVMRQDINGTEEIHAKCPHCGGEWNGDIKCYYVVGWVFAPTSHRAKMMTSIMQEVLGDGLAGNLCIHTVVEADTPMEAWSKAAPTNHPSEKGGYGMMVLPCSRTLYDEFQKEKQQQEKSSPEREMTGVFSE